MTELENPRLRPVGDLLNENFFIPRYQRGYRWGKQEITELLDDISQYYEDSKPSNTDRKAGKFFCLQPIVVKAKKWNRSNGDEICGWEVIDGQQRLTSLFIILTYLEDVRQHYDNKTIIYNIDFETRENCKLFFENKSFVENIDESNVDFYHISNAYKYVKDWFKDKQVLRIEILKIILNNENNVSVIWYEAFEEEKVEDEDESSIELFTRLNDGKIPLTDSELIKALLLQADLYPIGEERFVKQRLFEISTEWDDIEAKLQDEKMWFFLNDITYEPTSKIELIFKLLADKCNEKEKLIEYEVEDGKPKHYEFLVFEKYLAQKRNLFLKTKAEDKDIVTPINDIWAEIKNMYSTLYEWYNDHNLFHYIGFLLVNSNNKEKLIRDLIDLKLTKIEFENNVKERIAKSIKITKKDKESKIVKKLNQITYGDDNAEIIKILLLFNIEALILQKKENAKFPFNLYKKEKITSIEHIHPQNPPSIDTDEERAKVWLRKHKKSLLDLIDNEDINSETIKTLTQQMTELQLRFDKKVFEKVFSETIKMYNKISGFNDNELHTLYNLALVDKDTNSQLNNSFFDIKRELLKENKLGRYTPICTQKAFSKYYSGSPKEMIFWSSEDRQAYFDEIENVYNSFIELIPANNDN